MYTITIRNDNYKLLFINNYNMYYNVSISFWQLVMISEYLVRQMQDNIPSMTSSSDTDNSVNDGRQFIDSVGFIYQSKVCID